MRADASSAARRSQKTGAARRAKIWYGAMSRRSQIVCPSSMSSARKVE
jgi:hypothetical protein